MTQPSPWTLRWMAVIVAACICSAWFGCADQSASDKSAAKPAPAAQDVAKPSENPATKDTLATEKEPAKEPALRLDGPANAPAANAPAANAPLEATAGNNDPSPSKSPDDPAAPAKNPPGGLTVGPDDLLAAAPKDSDKAAVADGSPAEMLLGIARLQRQKPTGKTEDEMKANFKKTQQAILDASDKVLAAKPTDEQRVQAVKYKLQALMFLSRLGGDDEEAALRKFAESLTTDPDAEIAADGNMVMFSLRLTNVVSDKPEDPARLAADIKKFVEKGKPTAEQFGLVSQAARYLEVTDHVAEARQMYELFGLFTKSSDPEISEQARESQEAAEKRLALPGHSIELEGKLVNGKKFNWQDYKDKVVLVDFWATWCGPCVAELPNVKANYDKYHDKGFEVVGISLDDEKQDVLDFLKERKIQWQIIFNDQPFESPFMAPLPKKFGVMAIPMTVLVGRDGNVISLSARGPQLGKQLEKLLGAGGGKSDAAPDPKSKEQAVRSADLKSPTKKNDWLA